MGMFRPAHVDWELYRCRVGSEPDPRLRLAYRCLQTQDLELQRYEGHQRTNSDLRRAYQLEIDELRAQLKELYETMSLDHDKYLALQERKYYLKVRKGRYKMLKTRAKAHRKLDKERFEGERDRFAEAMAMHAEEKKKLEEALEESKKATAFYKDKMDQLLKRAETESERADRFEGLYAGEAKNVEGLIMKLSDAEMKLAAALDSESQLQATASTLATELYDATGRATVFEAATRDLEQNGRLAERYKLGTVDVREACLLELLKEKDAQIAEMKEEIQQKTTWMETVDTHAVKAELELKRYKKEMMELVEFEKWYLQGLGDLGPYGYPLPDKDVVRVTSTPESTKTD